MHKISEAVSGSIFCYFSYGENGIFVEQSLYNLHSDLFVTKPFLLHYC